MQKYNLINAENQEVFNELCESNTLTLLNANCGKGIAQFIEVIELIGDFKGEKNVYITGAKYLNEYNENYSEYRLAECVAALSVKIDDLTNVGDLIIAKLIFDLCDFKELVEILKVV